VSERPHPNADPAGTGARRMRYAALVDRIAGEGARAWRLHARAAERARRGEDVIVLSIGDPEVDTPPGIVEAAITSLRAGRHHYTPAAGEPALRRAVARRESQRTGRPTEAEQVVIFPGAQSALFACALCLLQPGDEVVVAEPAYVTYPGVVGATGAGWVGVSLPAEAAFRLQAADVAAALTPRTRALLLNTPHNPTGAVLDRDTLEALAELAVAHDLWVISDEVYADLTFRGGQLSPSALPALAERTAVVSSLSKSHAMSGWRIGWAVAPGELAGHLVNLAQCMLYGSPPFIQDAALAALEGDIPEIASTADHYRERAERVHRTLAEASPLRVHPPEAGVFVLVDVRGTGLGAQPFAERLLDQQGVGVLPCDAFGESVAGHVRLSLTATDPQVDEACRRIRAFVENL